MVLNDADFFRLIKLLHGVCSGLFIFKKINGCNLDLTSHFTFILIQTVLFSDDVLELRLKRGQK